MTIIPQGYKVTEIGVLPGDWEILPLNSISSQIGDGLHGTPKYSVNGKYFFINGNNLANGVIETNDETKRVLDSDVKNCLRDLSKNTILLSINGTIGNLAYYNSENILLGKSIAYINTLEKLNKVYIYYILHSSAVLEYFNNSLTGSTIKNLGLNIIRNTKIPIPPLPEQTAIATALRDIDQLISTTQALVAKKKAIKTATTQQLLTPKEDWVEMRLGDVTEINRNSGVELPQEFIYIDLESVSQGQLLKENQVHRNSAPSRAQRLLKWNDILYQTVRPYQKSNIITF
jgi:type I restriction enzyme S subunit